MREPIAAIGLLTAARSWGGLWMCVVIALAASGAPRPAELLGLMRAQIVAASSEVSPAGHPLRSDAGASGVRPVCGLLGRVGGPAAGFAREGERLGPRRLSLPPPAVC